MGTGKTGGAVTLTAPDPGAAADYYVEVLGLRRQQVESDRTLLVGYGTQLSVTRGEGGGQQGRPTREQATAELAIPLEHLEAAWERDRNNDPEREGPTLDDSGTFVYVTLDPAGNAIALYTPLPGESEGAGDDRVTQRLRPPQID